MNLRNILISLLSLFLSNVCLANNWGESGAWQFQSQQDRANKAAIVNLIESKKANVIPGTSNYTTYIDKQFNCNNSSTATGNSQTDQLTTTGNGSAVLNGSANASAPSNANSASNSSTTVSQAAVQSDPLSSLSAPQVNSGSVSSAIGGPLNGSTGSAATSGGGTQAINSNPINQGSQVSTLTGNTACVGPLVGSGVVPTVFTK